MDDLGSILPFLLAAGYLLIRFAGSRKRATGTAQSAPKPPPRRRQASGPTPFEQLVARLEAQANPPPRPAPPQRPAPPPALPLAAPRANRLASNMGMDQLGGFGEETAGYKEESAGFDHLKSDYEHGQHGFGPDNPYSEPVFQQSGQQHTPADRLSYDPHRAPGVGRPSRPSPGLSGRLQSPQALRDAFVLQTILDRPRPPRERRR